MFESGSLFRVLQLKNGRIDGARSGRCDVLFSPAGSQIRDNLPASAETREAKWLPLSNCHCSHSRKLDWSWPFLISPPLGRLVFSPEQGGIFCSAKTSNDKPSLLFSLVNWFSVSKIGPLSWITANQNDFIFACWENYCPTFPDNCAGHLTSLQVNFNDFFWRGS